MSETKHTAAERWKAVPGSEADDWGVAREETPAPFMDIAQMVGEEHARLIAASPELFSVCEATHTEIVGLIAYLETCDPDVVSANIDLIIAGLKGKKALIEAALLKVK